MKSDREDIIESNVKNLKALLNMELYESRSAGIIGLTFMRLPGGLLYRQAHSNEFYTECFIPRSEILADLSYFKAGRDSSGRYFVTHKSGG
jgi:hypothetical protein